MDGISQNIFVLAIFGFIQCLECSGKKYSRMGLPLDGMGNSYKNGLRLQSMTSNCHTPNCHTFCLFFVLLLLVQKWTNLGKCSQIVTLFLGKKCHNLRSWTVYRLFAWKKKSNLQFWKSENVWKFFDYLIRTNWF